MSSRIRNWIGTLTLLMVSFVAALFFAEVALRLFPNMLSEEAAIRLHWSMQGRGSPPSRHAYIGFVPRPEGFAEDADASGASAREIWGQRNLAPWPDTAEIVAVGDSFAYSQTVELHEAWTVLLDELQPDSRVITLGTIGSGPQQYKRVYETYGAQLSPKLVIVGLFMGNDMYDSEMFDRWWREARDQDFRYFRSEDGDTRVRVWLKKLSERSYLAALLRDVLRSRNVDRHLKGVTIEVGSGERLQLVPRYVFENSQIAFRGEKAFDLVVDSVSELCGIVDSHDATCLVLLFPSKEEVYGQFLDRDLPLLSGTVIDELEQRGIEYLDLGPRFRERAKDERSLYHEIDGHPTVLGYSLIAQTVSEHLDANRERYGLVPSD